MMDSLKTYKRFILILKISFSVAGISEFSLVEIGSVQALNNGMFG